MTQKQCVIEALVNLGGMATFSQLYAKTDTSKWGTKTPFASIRGIVQTNKEFYKIRPGLWGLKDFEAQNTAKTGDEQSGINPSFTHAYYQGIIVEIGNLRNFQTYVPAQDKNKLYLNKKLTELTTLKEIYNFSYENIVNKAKNVDAIWFNRRNLPDAFYEVEHSTDFKNSLNKFYELQDFNAKMFIVADLQRKKQFDGVLKDSIYESISKKVKFACYEDIVKQYEKESEIGKIPMGI